HPTAAVGGTPTGVAMDLIRELEGMDRGRYAGPVGWVDGRGNGVWGIALRCALLSGPSARRLAGGGVVADCDPAAEVAEAQSTFRVMQDALEGWPARSAAPRPVRISRVRGAHGGRRRSSPPAAWSPRAGRSAPRPRAGPA